MKNASPNLEGVKGGQQRSSEVNKTHKIGTAHALELVNLYIFWTSSTSEFTDQEQNRGQINFQKLSVSTMPKFADF